MSNYHIEQIEDPYLAHFAYLIVVGEEAIAIDPPRNPEKILELAKKYKAKIIGVIESHPHADFVSSHLEIRQKTGATIYAHELLGAKYEHIGVKEGDKIELGAFNFSVLHTPGHSPDSICLLFGNEKAIAIFTGDTLFIGDCGRPDLREEVGNVQGDRQDLARQMYHSLREKLAVLPDDTLVYPAHGAGSLCGKALKKANSSTMGIEKKENWSLQNMSEEEFVKELTSDQPFVPKYFVHAVALNMKGAPSFSERMDRIPRSIDAKTINPKTLIVDTRDFKVYRKQHLGNSINLMVGGKFETWLGTIIRPEETFYVLSETEKINEELIARIASIGYEGQVKGTLVFPENMPQSLACPLLDLEDFKAHSGSYTIIDVRNPKERKDKNIFSNSLSIPLGELRDRIKEIPTDKAIVVHCAAGYRSATAWSILKNEMKDQVIYDLGDEIVRF